MCSFAVLLLILLLTIQKVKHGVSTITSSGSDDDDQLQII